MDNFEKLLHTEHQLVEFLHTQTEPEKVATRKTNSRVWGAMDAFMKVPSSERVVKKDGKSEYCKKPDATTLSFMRYQLNEEQA